MEIGINDARPILGDLINRAWQGEDITITRNGKPVAMLTKPPKPEAPYGSERNWTLDVMSTVGALQAVVNDVLGKAYGTSEGSYYDAAYTMVGDKSGPPADLLRLKRELEARGYETAL